MITKIVLKEFCVLLFRLLRVKAVNKKIVKNFLIFAVGDGRDPEEKERPKNLIIRELSRWESVAPFTLFHTLGEHTIFLRLTCFTLQLRPPSHCSLDSYNDAQSRSSRLTPTAGAACTLPLITRRRKLLWGMGRAAFDASIYWRGGRVFLRLSVLC